MELSVKNMVCDRCVMSIKELLLDLGIQYERIELGKIHLINSLNEKKKGELSAELLRLGFELLESPGAKYIQSVKNAVIDLIRNQESALKKFTVSAFIEDKVGKDYKWLSSLFSEMENQTIEQYVIAQKVERVKELLTYDELSISEISDKLHYSSIAHLSNQFKKVTGITPSAYKSVGKRLPLDKI